PRYIAAPKASTKFPRVTPPASGARSAVTKRSASGTTTSTARMAALSSQTAGAASRHPVVPPPGIRSDPEQLAELLPHLVVTLLQLLGIDPEELQLLERPLVLRVAHGVVRDVEAVVGENLLGVLVEQEVGEDLRRVRMRGLGQDRVGRRDE